jgi:hypothetical protein
MKKTLIAILVSVFVFSSALACISSEKQTKQKNYLATVIPTWQSYEITENQINMMLCSVSVDSISSILANSKISEKTDIQTSSSKNNFSILTTPSVTTISLMNGDAVKTNEVDFSDIAAVRDAFGSCPEDENWNEMADVDGSGEVDFSDMSIVVHNFGESGD